MKRGRKSKACNAEIITKTRQLAAEGKCKREIAEALCVPYSSIAYHCRRHGINTIRRSFRRKIVYKARVLDIVADLFHSPATPDADVARKHFCTREFVGQIRKWGVVAGVLRANVLEAEL